MVDRNRNEKELRQVQGLERNNDEAGGSETG